MVVTILHALCHWDAHWQYPKKQSTEHDDHEVQRANSIFPSKIEQGLFTIQIRSASKLLCVGSVNTRFE